MNFGSLGTSHARCGAWIAVASLLATLVGGRLYGQSERSRFETSDSRSDYVHRIELFDERNNRILPGSGDRPYSPRRTCGRCHDYDHITTGFHFNPDANVQKHGRPGETWTWVDPATGTQLPISYRDWKNSFSPASLGISRWEFTHQLGGRTPGGYSGGLDSGDGRADDAAPLSVDRFHLSGALEADCMMCHARGSSFDMEAWSRQIADQNFGWASTAAAGLAKIDGQVRRLKDDFDIEASLAEDYSGPMLPIAHYDPGRFDAEGKVFFDVVRFPSNNACFRCHSNLSVGPGTAPRWTHDQDVHIRAGFQCVDCHRNDLGHNIVRGFETESHPQAEFTGNLTCRGCHLGDSTASQRGGRMGAPYPEHKGLPPIHLDRLSCTACHSGPLPQAEVELVQTALAHWLGQKAHRPAHQQPEIAQVVFMPDDQSVLHPNRVLWPSYWGSIEENHVTPLPPNQTGQWLRSVFRVRSDFTEELLKARLSRAEKTEAIGEERAKLRDSELSEDEKAKLAQLERDVALQSFATKMQEALVKLKTEHDVAAPAYVTGEKLYRLTEANELEVAVNRDVRPYAWPIAHDVRPARWALGATGCEECHSSDSAFFYSRVVSSSPVPDDRPEHRPMHVYAGLDPDLLDTWNLSFQGRTAFKWTALVSIISVSVIVLLFSVSTVAILATRRRSSR